MSEPKIKRSLEIHTVAREKRGGHSDISVVEKETKDKQDSVFIFQVWSNCQTFTLFPDGVQVRSPSYPLVPFSRAGPSLTVANPPPPNMCSVHTLLGLLAWTLSVVATASNSTALPLNGTVYATPHSQFSSSIGVLGCKVNTNRIAYWPVWPDCTNMCLQLRFGPRTRTVLHIDTSGGAHDISFDTFQYLVFGSSATATPAILDAEAGAPIDYAVVDMAQCADIITSDTGKLAFIANSPNQVDSCRAAAPTSWLAQHYELRNVLSSTCQYGIDEVCTLDDTTGTASCPSGDASSADVLDEPVIDYIAPCGVRATSGAAEPVANQCAMVTQTPNPSA